MEYTIGDIVLVPRGQKTRYFEVKDIIDNKLVLEDGWVQIHKAFHEVKLICKVGNRMDVSGLDDVSNQTLSENSKIETISTPLLFACLKKNYKAVCVNNCELEVFHSDKGLYQVDKFGHSYAFRPESYPTNQWIIQSKF